MQPDQAKASKKNRDRRVDRTRRGLRAALLALLSEKGYAEITVEEISKRADLSRATFYVHYKDKEDLLLEYLSDLADEQVQALANFSLAEWRLLGSVAGPEAPPVEPLLAAFRHVAEYAGLYGLVSGGEGAPRLSEKIGEIITRAVEDYLHHRLESEGGIGQLQAPIDLLARYFAGAFLSSVGWWMEGGLKLAPEEMTVLFQRLFFPGLRRALGLEASYSGGG